MHWFDILALVARTTQIAFGLAGIGLCVTMGRGYFLDPDFRLIIPCDFCFAGIVVFSSFSLPAIIKPGSLHWLLAILLDLAGLSCAIAAAALLTLANTHSWAWNYEWPLLGLSIPATVLAYLCMLLLVPAFIQDVQLMRKSRRSTMQIQKDVTSDYELDYYPAPEQHRSTPYDVDNYPPPIEHRSAPREDSRDLRRSSAMDDPGKNVKSTRSVSLADTTVPWSDCGATTITRPPSTLYAESAAPPSYASPKPSRAPTTIYRNPVNGTEAAEWR